MNESQLAAAAFQFLRRVQISGDEAPTLMATMQWLQQKAQPQPPPPEQPQAPAEQE